MQVFLYNQYSDQFCPTRHLPQAASVSGRETPLPQRGISPKGEKILFYLVELHLFAEIFPPLGGNKKGVIITKIKLLGGIQGGDSTINKA